MAIKDLKKVQSQFVLDSISCTYYNENTRKEFDITDYLTTKGKLQYIADAFTTEAVYENNIRKFKGNMTNMLGDHLSGLPNWIEVPYMYNDVLKQGREWGYDLSSGKKEDVFCQNWYNLVATKLIQLMDKHDVAIKNYPFDELEFSDNKKEEFLATQNILDDSKVEKNESFDNLTTDEVVALFLNSEWGQGTIKGHDYEANILDYKGIKYSDDNWAFCSAIFDDIKNDSFEGISLSITISSKENPFGKGLLNKTISSNEDRKVLDVLPETIRHEYASLLAKKSNENLSNIVKKYEDHELSKNSQIDLLPKEMLVEFYNNKEDWTIEEVESFENKLTSLWHEDRDFYNEISGFNDVGYGKYTIKGDAISDWGIDGVFDNKYYSSHDIVDSTKDSLGQSPYVREVFDIYIVDEQGLMNEFKEHIKQDDTKSNTRKMR